MAATARSVAGLALFALLLFLPAGTADWPSAWVFLALFAICGLATGLWLRRTDPALLAERMRSPLSGLQRPRDRAIMVALFLAFAAWSVFMGLDERFGWSRAPRWAQALGAVLILVAFWGWILVLRANSFASVTVRVQAERGQTVATTGPYAVVRHPMYAYALLFLIGAPLLLGSLWGVAWLAIFLPLLAARTLGEEAVLMHGLPGYREYATKVRYRLVPGIW